MSYSPWADLADRPEIVFGITRLEKGAGVWLPHKLAIILDDRLSRVQRRCTLAHELVHAEHADVQVSKCGPDGPRLARRQEATADRRAARRLIPTADLVVALVAHPDDPHLVAEHLDVTVEMLAVRLATLHAAEQALLAEEVARADHAA